MAEGGPGAVLRRQRPLLLGLVKTGRSCAVYFLPWKLGKGEQSRAGANRRDYSSNRWRSPRTAEEVSKARGCFLKCINTIDKFSSRLTSSREMGDHQVTKIVFCEHLARGNCIHNAADRAGYAGAGVPRRIRIPERPGLMSSASVSGGSGAQLFGQCWSHVPRRVKFT